MNNVILSSQPREHTKLEERQKTKNKLDIKKIKTNTINSLNEVETFLNNFHRFRHYIKLYKILK